MLHLIQPSAQASIHSYIDVRSAIKAQVSLLKRKRRTSGTLVEAVPCRMTESVDLRALAIRLEASQVNTREDAKVTYLRRVTLDLNTPVTVTRTTTAVRILTYIHKVCSVSCAVQCVPTMHRTKTT